MARWSMAWVALAATGCLRAAPPVQAPTSAPVAVVAVLDPYDEAPVASVPAEVLDALLDEVRRHNLDPVALDDPDLRRRYATVRTTDERVALARQATDVPAVLLVQTAARFGAQVNGRYRWSVSAELTLVDGSLAPVSAAVTVPVHLVYDRDREPAAVQEATPIIARHVGTLLDAWIGAGTP